MQPDEAFEEEQLCWRTFDCHLQNTSTCIAAVWMKVDAGVIERQRRRFTLPTPFKHKFESGDM